MLQSIKANPLQELTAYLTIIPILMALVLLGKVMEGTQYKFVYKIVALTMVNNIADVIFNV